MDTLRHLNSRSRGFTIVELLIVIVIIAILATITIIAFNGVTSKARNAAIQSDLQNAAKSMEIAKISASDNTYPTSLPSDIKASNGDVLQLTSTGRSDSFCINIYGSSGETNSFSSSSESIRPYLCDGATIGSPVGGTVPTAPRGVNLEPDFVAWTLSGGATYDGTTLTLGTTGIATSPLIRVDSPTSIKVGGDYYATTVSPSSSIAPNGGFHINIYYYASDGTTAVKNSANYTGNGYANGFALNTWDTHDARDAFTGGPLVIYVRWTFSGSSAGYASPDLKIKNPTLTISG